MTIVLIMVWMELAPVTDWAGDALRTWGDALPAGAR
jgi:hypothetical protein